MNVTSPFKGEELSYRQEILPQYKADRSHNTDLIDGVRLLFRFLKTLPVTVIYPSVRYEADDLVSFVVRRAYEDHMLEKMGKYEVIVVSDDKDFHQLICSSNGFGVVLHKKNDDIWDAKKFRKNFGFAPGMFIPYLALLGDKGDNIPGVHGYGKVKSSAMVRNNKWDKISEKLTEEEGVIFVKNISLIELNSGSEVVSKIYQPSLDREKFNRLSKRYKMVSFLRKEEQEILETIRKVSFLGGR
jgi:5'-3' exonuclease